MGVICLWQKEEGGHLTLDSRRKNQGERGGSLVFSNTDFMVQKLCKTWAEEIKKKSIEYIPSSCSNYGASMITAISVLQLYLVLIILITLNKYLLTVSLHV